MGFFKDLEKKLAPLNPASKNFLWSGDTKTGRILGGIFSGGVSELHRPDPYGVPRYTAFSRGIGGSTTGAATGAGTGFLVGGPWGAIVGGVVGGIGGAVAGITGASNNYTIGGVAKNVGIGVGAGVTGGAAVNYFAGATAVAGGAGSGVGATTAGVGGATTASGAATAGTAVAGSTGGGVLSTLGSSLGSLAVVSLLQRPGGQAPGGQPGANDIYVGSSGPGPGNVGGSTDNPNYYPGLSSGGVFDTSAVPMPGFFSSPTSILFIAAAAVLAFFIFRKH